VSDHAPEPNCLNCGAELQGKFCHACGQKGSSVNVGMHDFVHEATHEFLHLDGKILQTVKLLVARPGELTREFLAGRRARYISPLRVYLTFSLLFFTLAAVLPSSGTMKVRRTEGPGLAGDTEFERRLERGLSKAEQDAESLGQAVLHNLPKAMFVLMPVFALLTWAFYRKQQRFYIPHLYYSVHFHAFTFLVMSAYALVSRVIPKQVAVLLLLTAIPYHFLGLRRVFGGSRWMTFAKGMAVGMLYWLAVAAVVIAVTITILISL
jgi:Protein of unknown function (DUF3667)